MLTKKISNNCRLNNYNISSYPSIESHNFYKNLDIMFSKKGFINTNKTKKNKCLGDSINIDCSNKLVSNYINPQSPYRGILLYHSVGSGKTLTTFNILANFVKQEPDRAIYFITPPGLTGNITNECNKFSSILPPFMNQKMNILSYISFGNRLRGKARWTEGIHKGYYKKDNGTMSILETSVIAIDECHNFTNESNHNFENNIFQQIYKSIRKAKNIRIILLSGTPIKEKPYQISKIINLLKPLNDKYELPETELEFNELFIQDNNVINLNNISFFVRALKGCISYLNIENDTSRFARKKDLAPQNVVMSAHQYKLWKKNNTNNFINYKLSNIISGYQQYYMLPKCFRDIGNCSPKLVQLYQNISHNTQYKHFIYSNFEAHGIRIIKEYLKYKHWKELTPNIIYKMILNYKDVLKSNWKPRINNDYVTYFINNYRNRCFVVLSNQSDSKKLSLLIQELYNLEINTRGELIKIIIVGNKYKEELV